MTAEEARQKVAEGLKVWSDLDDTQYKEIQKKILTAVTNAKQYVDHIIVNDVRTNVAKRLVDQDKFIITQHVDYHDSWYQISWKKK